jgi:uncharacterized protein YoxC
MEQNKLGIRKTLLFSYLAIFGGIILVGILSSLMSFYQRKLTEKQEQRYQSYLLADQLRQSSDDLTRMARTYVITGDSKYEKIYWDILAIRNGQKARPENYDRIYWDLVLNYGDKPRPDGETIALQELMKRAGFTEEEFGKLREAQNASDSLVTTETIAMNALKGLYNDGTGNYIKRGEPDQEMAIKIMHDLKYHQDKAVIMRPIDDFFVLVDQRTKSEVEKYTRLTNLLLGLTQLTLFLLILLSLGLAIFINKKVINPLETIILQLQDTGTQLTASTTQIAAAGKELEATMTEQTASSNEVTATVQEIAATTHSLTQTMNDVSDLAFQTADSANNSKEQLQEIAVAISQLLKATKSIGEKLSIMSEKANNINGVIITITKVADQTNLLSLNAAIEAEKAGQYGAGFAVVAREIRRLADQTAIATLEIEKIVREMQSSVSMAVMEMDKFTQEVNHRVADVEGISKQISNVIEQVQNIPIRFTTVSQSMSEQSQGATQISIAMSQLNEASQQITSSLRDTNEALINLENVAQKLREQLAISQQI